MYRRTQDTDMLHLSASHDMQRCQLRKTAKNGVEDLIMQILDALKNRQTLAYR